MANWDIGLVTNAECEELNDEAFMSFGDYDAVDYCEATFHGKNANRHAIAAAAAPQMLEVLKAMSEAVLEQPVGVWRHAINAAIAAATGGDDVSR